MRFAIVIALALTISACGIFKGSKSGGNSGWGASSDAPKEVAQAEAVQEPVVTAEGDHKAGAYDALARMHRADARGDDDAVEIALDDAMTHARALMASGNPTSDVEIRELYRSVITAYEAYYGAADTTSEEYGDIFELRDEMFATMNDVEEPLVEDAELPEAPRLGGAIPMTTNRLVEQSVRFLQKDPQKHIYPWLRRSGTYFPMIEKILREEGVPEELKFLAMIESGLNPEARSRVGAGGMWQFMPATGRAYGLDITNWVDERSDPEKATRAAAKHLRDLYEMFGDWHLSLAAYNCGPTRVRRAVKRFEASNRRKATFWDIYRELPRETRNYVPMYIAASMVASDPASFGLSRVEPGPSYDFDVVEVEGPMDLQVVADLADTGIDTIRELNPEIRRGTVPPAAYRLRIPSGTARGFDREYAALPKDARRSITEHRVRRGETLSKIAGRYGTTVNDIRAYNSIRGSLIRTGETLIIPVRADRSSATPVRYASDRTSSSGPSASEPESSNLRVRYRVRRGDNLTNIARRYDVSVSEIRSWNDLSSSRIYSGQTLTLYPENAQPSPRRSGWISYRVKRGDTLTSIARAYDATPAQVRKWNALRTDVIRAGQRLAIYR